MKKRIIKASIVVATSSIVFSVCVFTVKLNSEDIGMNNRQNFEESYEEVESDERASTTVKKYSVLPESVVWEMDFEESYEEIESDERASATVRKYSVLPESVVWEMDFEESYEEVESAERPSAAVRKYSVLPENFVSETQ